MSPASRLHRGSAVHPVHPVHAIHRGPLLLLLLLSLLLPACGKPDTSLDDVQRRGTMIVGLDASYPPFETVGATGDVEGLDADLARLLATDMGLGVEFRNISFDGLYDALAAGQVDVIISALPYDALRTEDVTYSPAYFDDGLVWVSAQVAVMVPTPPAGSVAVEMGSEAAALVADAGSAVTVQQLLSEADAITAVANGTAVMGVVTRLSACLAVSGGSSVSIGAALSQAPYVAAVRADRAALAAAVNDSMTDIIAGEDWRDARRRWLGEACE